MRTEGKVSIQKHHKDKMERTVWFGERKRVTEKRPPTGGQGQSREEPLLRPGKGRWQAVQRRCGSQGGKGLS